MDVGYALLCGLLVELADLGFAVAGYFEEALVEHNWLPSADAFQLYLYQYVE
jgi:hypothetical protein